MHIVCRRYCFRSCRTLIRFSLVVLACNSMPASRAKRSRSPNPADASKQRTAVLRELLRGAWSSAIHQHISIGNDACVEFNEEEGRSPVTLLSPVENDVHAIELNGWRANGVRVGASAITWHKDKDPNSPLLWTRVSPQSVCSQDDIEKDINEVETLFGGMLAKLRKKAAADVVPLCKICLANPIGFTMLGCGHVLCGECGKTQFELGKPCFMCKTPFAGKQALFFS
eukprot:TRINITY_DN124041_c0_g1_i1.p1 TRINITY_DN124041_c0_g1~~TRINITY_DN124041_c0_g1_i1.p1  ORF type:complete len:227 (-),score=16.78 TRINITY_DN124041_c0_g1_i1:48-728(-)